MVTARDKQFGLLKRQAYLIALPVTLLAVVLTSILQMGSRDDLFNRLALPLLAAALLLLTLLLYLRLVPLRWIEHGFYLVASGTFLAKFGSLALQPPLLAPDARIAQVYIWAPFVYLLGFLIYGVRKALQRSLVLYGLSFLVGTYAVVSFGPQSLGNFARLIEFYLASGLWLAMLYVLGTVKTRIGQLQMELGEMHLLAHQDALTGVNNRRQMEALLSDQVEQFKQYGTSWAVILFDIDNFKQVNDIHGHESGDQVLRRVARLMQDELRSKDQLARWGGEEFLILITRADLVLAHSLAERLRTLLAQYEFEAIGSVTASFGVAAYHDGESVASLIQRADKTLYLAKHGGKNRVEMALMTVPALVFPQLRNPFPDEAPEIAPELCREGSAWLERFGLGPQDDASRSAFTANFAGLAARLHPRASREALRLTTDWYSLMFLHDDRCDSSGIGKDPARLKLLTDRLLKVFLGSPAKPEDEPLARALADLRRRLLAYGGARWFQGLSEQVIVYFNALKWEAANRAEGTVPALSEYLQMRPVTAGLQIDEVFIEMMDGVRVSGTVLNHPAVQHLVTSANRAVCWSNDLLSLEKELQEGDVHNLVVVLMQDRSLKMQLALKEAAHMYHQEVDQFLAGEAALPSFGAQEDAQLRQYVHLLKARIGGIMGWSQRANRYQVTVLELSAIPEAG